VHGYQAQEKEATMDAPDEHAIDSAREHLAAAVEELLAAVGDDITREGLQSTPTRVADSFIDFFSGVRLDPAEPLTSTFAAQSDDLVIVRDIPVSSFCEHHLLPFSGVAHIAYSPDRHVAGLSKFSQSIHVLARRPQIQENLTAQVADVIFNTIAPRGVVVKMTCVHTCMTMRGGHNQGSSVTTIASRGTFQGTPEGNNAIFQLG
jgi:GTP cyclohydrolase I